MEGGEAHPPGETPAGVDEEVYELDQGDDNVSPGGSQSDGYDPYVPTGPSESESYNPYMPKGEADITNSSYIDDASEGSYTDGAVVDYEPEYEQNYDAGYENRAGEYEAGMGDVGMSNAAEAHYAQTIEDDSGSVAAQSNSASNYAQELDESAPMEDDNHANAAVRYSVPSSMQPDAAVDPEKEAADQLQRNNERLKAPDCIMELDVLSILRNFIGSGGQPRQAIKLLAENYKGYAEMTNLVLRWLTLVGEDSEELNKLVLSHLRQLVIDNFDAKAADSILRTEGSIPEWLQVQVTQHTPKFDGLCIRTETAPAISAFVNSLSTQNDL